MNETSHMCQHYHEIGNHPALRTVVLHCVTRIGLLFPQLIDSTHKRVRGDERVLCSVLCTVCRSLRLRLCWYSSTEVSI